MVGMVSNPRLSIPRQGFSVSQQGLRLGLTPDPVGPRQGHALEPAGS